MTDFFKNMYELRDMYNEASRENKQHADFSNDAEKINSLITNCGLNVGEQQDMYLFFIGILARYPVDAVNKIFGITEESTIECKDETKLVVKKTKNPTITSTTLSIPGNYDGRISQYIAGTSETMADELDACKGVGKIKEQKKTINYKPTGDYIYVNIKLHAGYSGQKLTKGKVSLLYDDKIITEEKVYEKFAIIVHMSGDGGGSDSGHYVIYIKKNNIYYLIDENKSNVIEQTRFNNILLEKDRVSNIVYKNVNTNIEDTRPVGINAHGGSANTCYFKATLQLLFNIPSFVELIEREKIIAELDNTGTNTRNILAAVMTQRDVSTVSGDGAISGDSAISGTGSGNTTPYFIHDKQLPVHFMGDYDPNNPDETSVQGYATANDKALVLFSANDGNKGAWSNQRETGGTGQAQDIEQEIYSNTFGLHTGLKDNPKDIWDVIKKSLEELENFYVQKRDKYDYIAIPYDINKPLNIYTGAWKDKVKGDDIDRVNALFTTRLLYGKERSEQLEKDILDVKEEVIKLHVIRKESNTYKIGENVEGKGLYVTNNDIIGTDKQILYLMKEPTEEEKKAHIEKNEKEKKIISQKLAELKVRLKRAEEAQGTPAEETSTDTQIREEIVKLEGKLKGLKETTASQTVQQDGQPEANIFSSAKEKLKKDMKLAAESGATDWKRVSADVSSFKDGSPTVTEPEYYYSNTLDIKIHFDPREATIDEAQKYIDNVDKELREFPSDGDQVDKEKLEKKLENAKHVLESVRLYKKKEQDPDVINEKKVDKMSHMLFVSYLEEDDQTEYKGNIENIKNIDMYKKILYNKIKTVGIYLEPVKNITRYLQNREEQLKTDYAIKLASKEGTQFEMEKSKALKENTGCVIQSLGRMETTKDFLKKSIINRLELEGHLLEKINKEMDNEKTLDIYNTSYELEYFRKLFPTFKYDTSLETTPKYDLNIMLTKDFVEDPCDLFKVKKTEYSTEFSNKKEGVRSLPKIVSVIYNYKHTYLNAEKINNDNTGDAIEPLYNLKTDCIDVTNAKTEGLLGDVYKYAFNNVMLDDNMKHINQAKYVYEKIKKEAALGKEKPLKIMAEYVGPNPHIAEKYGKDSEYCKKKLSDMGRGKEEDFVKSKICRASAIAGLKLPLLNKKITERLEDILEEIETKLKIENKTKKKKMPSTVDKDKDKLAMLEKMLQTS